VCVFECVYVMPFLFYLELGISLLTRHCHNFRYMFWAAFVVLRPRDGGVAKLFDMLMSCKLSLIKLHCCCRHFSCQLRRMYGKLWMQRIACFGRFMCCVVFDKMGNLSRCFWSVKTFEYLTQTSL